MNNPPIPQTDSIKELAEFWDTHDLTDFEDDLEEVTEPAFQPRATLRVYLTPADAAAVQQIAQARGVACEHLLRQWVLERLRNG